MRDKNPLYSLILESNIIFLKKQNRALENYLLIDLPLPQDPFVITIGSKEYKLTNFHITVFDKYQRPASNFHCSGEFESADGEQVKLRSFSGLNDKLQEPKLFTKINDEYVFSNESLSAEDNSLFVALSSKDALPIINPLRQEQEKLIAERRNAFEPFYLALKKDLYDHSEKIDQNLDSIAQALQLLDRLAAISPQTYKQEYMYLDQMKKAFQIAKKQSSIEIDVLASIDESEQRVEIAENVEEVDSSAGNDVVADNTGATQTSKQQKIQKKIADLVQDFQDNMVKIKAYPYQSDNITAQKFKDGKERLEVVLESKQCIEKLQSTLDSLLGYMDSSNYPELKSIAIQKMTADFSEVLRLHNGFCVHSLKHFLLSSDVNSADSLKEFIADLDDRFLKILLSNDKLSASLSFMYQNYPVNETTIETVLDKDNNVKLPILSAVYARGYIHCFRALLRDHQASPLVLDKTGWPLLHTLLQLPASDPFRQVLQEEYQDLNLPSTYRTLCYGLNVYLKANPSLASDQQDNLQQALKRYRAAQNNPQLNSIEKLYESNLQMTLFKIGQNLNPEVVDNLKRSSDYTKQIEDLNKSAKKLQLVIRKAHLTQKFAKANKDYYEKLECFANSHSEAFANMSESNCSAELEIMTLLNPLIAEAIETQTKLRSMAQYKGKPGQKQKDLLGEFANLQRSMKQLAPGIEKIFNHDPEESESFSISFGNNTTAKERRKGLAKMEKHLSKTLGSLGQGKKIMEDMMRMFNSDPFEENASSSGKLAPSSIVEEEIKEETKDNVTSNLMNR